MAGEKLYDVVFKQTLDVEKEEIRTDLVSGSIMMNKEMINEMAEAYKQALLKIFNENGGENNVD
jgi:hypothetical protein